MQLVWHFANIESATGRLREFVRCVLFTLNMPPGVWSKRVNPCFVLFCLAWIVIWQGLCTFGNFYKKLNNVIIGAPLASGLPFSLSRKTCKAVFFLTDGICFPFLCMPLNQLICKTHFIS